MPATFKKLKDGSWGLKVTEEVKEGDVVRVQKKDGSVESKTVGKVLWAGGGVWITTVVADAAREPNRRLHRDGTYECEECGDYVRPGSRCWETGAAH